MHSLALRNAQLEAAIAASGIALAIGAWLLLRRKPEPPEERERRRRAHLSLTGRIIDGIVLDASAREDEGGDPAAADLIFYQYEIAGVTYESSQEVTHLRDHVDLRNCRVDLPASVRYDAKNPANSIVISESWNGLRFCAPSAAEGGAPATQRSGPL